VLEALINSTTSGDIDSKTERRIWPKILHLLETEADKETFDRTATTIYFNFGPQWKVQVYSGLAGICESLAKHLASNAAKKFLKERYVNP